MASEPDDSARIYHRPEPLVIGLQPTRSVLHVSPSFSIHGTDAPPNLWWRMWHWLLLGWYWERR